MLISDMVQAWIFGDLVRPYWFQNCFLDAANIKTFAVQVLEIKTVTGLRTVSLNNCIAYFRGQVLNRFVCCDDCVNPEPGFEMEAKHEGPSSAKDIRLLIAMKETTYQQPIYTVD